MKYPLQFIATAFLSLSVICCAPGEVGYSDSTASLPVGSMTTLLSQASGKVDPSADPNCVASADAQNGLRSYLSLFSTLIDEARDQATISAAQACVSQAQTQIAAIQANGWKCSAINSEIAQMDQCYQQAKSHLVTDPTPVAVAPVSTQPVSSIFEFKYQVTNTYSNVPGPIVRAVVNFREGAYGLFTVPVTATCFKRLALTSSQRTLLYQGLARVGKNQSNIASQCLSPSTQVPADHGIGEVLTNYERSDSSLLEICADPIESYLISLIVLAEQHGNEACQ